MADIALTAAAVFALNLLPAFGPPTWALLVFLRLNLEIAAVPLVLTGALSAAAGRWVLALGSRRARGRLSAERRANLEAARDAIESRPSASLALAGLFLVSPLPSAQLFVAAGLTDVRLRPLVAAFCCGRLVTYSIYVTGATVAERQFGDVLTDSLTSPAGLALQIVMLALLVALVRIDWTSVLRRRAGR